MVFPLSNYNIYVQIQILYENKYNIILPVECRFTGGGGGGELGLATATLRRLESIDDGGLFLILTGRILPLSL